VARAPLPEPALALVVDLEAVAGGYRDAIAAFLAQPPVAAAFALRALAGVPDDCSATHGLRPLGPWAPDGLLAALDGGLGAMRGPRNPVAAVAGALGDLSAASGERTVVVIAGGEPGCGGDLCAATAPGEPPVRVHAILLVPRPEDPESAPPPAPFEVPADPPGSPGTAASRSARGARWRRREPRRARAAPAPPGPGLESSIVVRGFHGRGLEVRGIARRARSGGRASARPAPPTGRRRCGSRSLCRRPSRCPRDVDLRCQYEGLLRRVPVSVAPGSGPRCA